MQRGNILIALILIGIINEHSSAPVSTPKSVTKNRSQKQRPAMPVRLPSRRRKLTDLPNPRLALLDQFFEGDIVGDPFGLLSREGVPYSAIYDTNLRWPNGVIPYEISSTYVDWERSIILGAMRDIEQRTCIRFKPRTTEVDYIQIFSGSGCWSWAGRNGGLQQVSLKSPGCISIGLAEHELMHVIGFYHEQSRVDRDNFVNIFWTNIRPGKEVNFFKVDTNNLQLPYDVESVMHYGRNDFASNLALPTLTPKFDTTTASVGQRNGMSRTDVMKVNRLYNCPEPVYPSELRSGERLGIGGQLRSADGRFRLQVTYDGDLILYCERNNAEIWSAQTHGLNVTFAEMKTNGDLVVSNSTGGAVWSTITTVPGSSLQVQNDGNVKVVSPAGVVQWSSSAQSFC